MAAIPAPIRGIPNHEKIVLFRDVKIPEVPINAQGVVAPSILWEGHAMPVTPGDAVELLARDRPQPESVASTRNKPTSLLGSRVRYPIAGSRRGIVVRSSYPKVLFREVHCIAGDCYAPLHIGLRLRRMNASHKRVRVEEGCNVPSLHVGPPVMEMEGKGTEVSGKVSGG